MVDPLAPGAERLRWISAAESKMARIEQEADVCELEHALDLPRCLDERRSVVVECRLHATRASKIGGASDALGQASPAGGVEADRVIRGGPTGKLCALRRARVRKDSFGLVAV